MTLPAPGSAEPVLVVHPTAEDVAAVTAGRLLAAILEAQTRSPRGEADIVLTGGGVGTGVLKALATAPGRDAADWSRVVLWWGDDRWVPAGDPERNADQARAALLDLLPLAPENVHAMAPRGPGDDLSAMEVAAADYARQLAARAAERGEDGPVPAFDVLMLGTGPEGHVASLFPETAAVAERDRTVVTVTDSPKPPAERLSLTLPALQAAREVWLVTAGAEKADAVAGALAGRPAEQLPASGARGRLATLWLVDRSAARR